MLLRGSGGAGIRNGSKLMPRRLKRVSPIKTFGESNGNIVNKNRKHTTFGAGRDIEEVRPTIYGNGGNNNGMFHRENNTKQRVRRIKSKAPTFRGGPTTFGNKQTPSTPRSFRNGNTGGVIASNATSKNNPMLTNHLQSSPHPFGTNAKKVVRG
jgi:hypothetical protein